MGYKKVYRMTVDNFEGQRLVCDLLDKTSQVPGDYDTQFISIKGSGEPLKLSVIDNDEDKFTPIRAHQLQISFISTPEINLNTFAEGEDDRWFVELSYTEGTDLKRIFTGYLSMSDLQEDFMYPPNIVTLTATDKLGSLKDVPLVDLNGETPKGKYSIVDYLTMALRGTGMTIALNVCNSMWGDNMVVKDGIDLGWWYTYLDAKSFEDEIGTCIDCYAVLERILGEDCFLTQYRGEWWVVRVEEMDGRGLKVYQFDYTGAYAATMGRQPFERGILKNSYVLFSGESTSVSYERPYKSVKETYNYEYPQEIVDNINFERGGQIMVTNTENLKQFHIEDWQMVRPFGQAVTATAYYERRYEDGYEKEGYAVVTPQSVYASPYDYLRCNPVELQYKDKVKVSVDFRFDRNLSSVGGMAQYIFFIYLKVGNTYYYLNQPTSGDMINLSWYPSATENVRLIDMRWNSQQQDERDWQNISVTTPPLPADGVLYIGLMNGRTNVNFNGNIHYKNLQVEITEYINGSYAKYDGQYFRTSQGGGYNAVRDEEIYLSDSPRKLFKGALWAKKTTVILGHEDVSWFLTTKWTDRSNAAFSEWKPYGWWKTFVAWNQYKRTMRVFDAQVQGCYGADLFGLMHLFLLKDASPHTNKKKFMLLHYELDLVLCAWSGVLVEIMDDTKPKSYSEQDNNLEFKYIESR